MNNTRVWPLMFLFVCTLALPARAQAPAEKAPAVCSDEELTSNVPELEQLHEVIYQMWHEAYPDKNCAMIKELLPQADDLTAKLDKAELPGILRDKQARWDEGKKQLTHSLQELHAAADANDEAAMLSKTEEYHAAFEVLVRTIRPVTPEMDAFHQELYKLYHYYAPGYDLTNIRASATAMQAQLPALTASRLPARLASRQEKFNDAVASLSAAVNELVKTSETNNKEEILALVEKVHGTYVDTLAIFE